MISTALSLYFLLRTLILSIYRRFETDSLPPVTLGSDLAEEVQIDPASVVHAIVEVVAHT
jgi:hypothetical protein